mmetsp:Transcript_983/g.1396  ORF Transcript_983/g.1396 Transcript_983/m.1396 type:complete len:259 (-) Transcript_983:31-807(-)
MDVECLSYEEFRDVCENNESCSPNVIRLLEDSFRIYASVLFLMAIPAIFGAIGTIYFRAFHPNEFFSRFSRSESFLMAFTKQNRKWLKCIFIFHLATLFFAFYAYSEAAEACMGARTNSGSEFVQPQSAENVLVLGLILISGMAVLSTWVACFIPIRGELTNQPEDEGRECTSIFIMNYCCCKQFRARPSSEPQICRTFTILASRLCPTLPGKKTANLLRNCTFVILRAFFNCLFCFTCAPIGWILETCYVQRHYVTL